jgi:hypothetical protein
MFSSRQNIALPPEGAVCLGVIFAFGISPDTLESSLQSA